ncbi:MAG: tRNA uridine-5-carboxymethylaminomethyl(34) synthesis enzyme MnmG [Thermoanaerobaculales bacterium]|nr:tRNA uridine-5-carboxymethylaminomethyl(34) synthesis enzyme MnmG [Thermoanaerobaculales bacterium]
MSGFDVVVVGGGHAGCEAAAAAARMGASVALVTLDRRTVAQMPCNPAIGGIGKGHLVAEIDALGGLQGWAADRAGIQFKTLNRSRGPAVRGPRAQCDKAAYQRSIRRVVEKLRGLTLIEAEVAGLVMKKERASGVFLLGGERLEAGAVILTTGTFLGGLLHTGEERRPGGRLGELPSTTLGEALAEAGLELRRFKTGTPPRLNRASIDFDQLEEQEGDTTPRPFSWRTRAVHNRCVCWVTRTPREVQTVINDNLHRSPLLSGAIEGVGPRYCPSIEDKVVRFPHHHQHTVFLEPEGLDSNSIYVNGLSTSLPADVQEAVVHQVPGLQRAEFLRYGYAVEYDVVAPLQVGGNLECSSLPGLFLAGQLLGTSGYEEAAGLGLLAGINAVAALRGEAPFIPAREDAYLGVLVDDVCGRDHREPYRMFTSRAEHRLLLGVDTARERMMEHGHRLGLVREAAFHVERARWCRRRDAAAALDGARLTPTAETRKDVFEKAGIDLSAPTTWATILRRQDVDAESVAATLQILSGLDAEDRRIVIGRLRYDGYLARQERERSRLHRLRHIPIPLDLDASAIPGLSREVVEAIGRDRPRTLADAERVPGMTPAAMAILAGRVARRGGEG